MTHEDKLDLERLLKDLTIELRDVRNSIAGYGGRCHCDTRDR